MPTELASLQRVWADQGYPGAFAEWLHESRGWQLEVGRHADRQLVRYGLTERPTRAFRVLPRRWIVERTFAPRSPCDAGQPGRLGQSRRLSKDYERLPETSEAMIYGAMSRLMLRRLTAAPARPPRGDLAAC